MAVKPSGIPEVLARYAPRLGEVVFTWNFAMEAFELLFLSLVKPGIAKRWKDRDKSDKDRLKMLFEEAKSHKKVLASGLQKQLEWSIGAAHKLRVKRNDAVHTALVVVNKEGGLGMEQSPLTEKRKGAKTCFVPSRVYGTICGKSAITSIFLDLKSYCRRTGRCGNRSSKV